MKTRIVDVWLVQYSADRSNGIVLPDGAIWPTKEKALEFAARIGELPWCRCISLSGPFKQEIPVSVAYDTSDESVLGFVLGGDPKPSQKPH